MKNPFKIVISAVMISLVLIGIGRLIISARSEPALWLFVIAMQVLTMLLLAVSVLINTRKLNPRMSWFPPF